ncbi:MAG: hypothetical protein ACOY94_24350 [Bacillota bacterium]
MRQWMIVLSIIALLIYAGRVLEHNQQQTALPSEADITALEKAMRGAGGSLEGVRFLLVAPIADPAVPGGLEERLGWAGPPRGGEFREARLYTEHGMYYLALDWRMTGEQVARWAANHRNLSQALRELGIATPVHVQLEGRVAATARNLLEMTNQALDQVAAEGRQPWNGKRSASVAGRSAYLPKGPHEVNVQAAARQTGKDVRLWVAWPALTGDY